MPYLATVYSRSFVPVTPTRESMALYAASTGPVPRAARVISFSVSESYNVTVAVGLLFVPARTCRYSR